MADILKLKKKAADFEAKKQMDKALDVYREIVVAYEEGNEDTIDIPLYNRVGDMLQKAGNLPEAVSTWEKAVDHYTEGGFFNPAIALCNKILRASPGRTVIYYKLGKIHAEKGFKGDARQNFLEYASRQQKAGNLDDAFKALKEFAELVPDQYDVRLMLADQLVKAARKEEAIAQLQLGYAQASADGNEQMTAEIAAKMKEIDPSVEPMAAEHSSGGGGGGLVFLDLDDGSAPPAPAARKARPTPLDTKRASRAIEGLSLLHAEIPAVPFPAAKPGADKVGPAKPAAEKKTPTEPSVELVKMDLEPTDVGANAPPPRGSLIGLEVTNLGDEAESSSPDLPMLDVGAPSTPDLPLTGREKPPTSEIQLIDLEPTVAEAPPTVPTPMLEIETTVIAEAVVELPLITPEPSFGGNIDLLSVEPSVTGDIPIITPEPSFGETIEIPEPPSFGGDLPLLSETPSGGMELSFLEMTPVGGIEAVPESSVELPMLDTSEDVVEDVVEDLVEDVVEDSSARVEAEILAAAEEAAEEAAAEVVLPLLSDTPVTLVVSVGELRARVDAQPDDFAVRRQYAEAILEQGDRAAALKELEAAMTGFEQQGDLDTAGSVAEEIVRLEPKSIRFHQKRVEFAFRANDRGRLAEAYVELADALLADGQTQKARAVYQRVLDIKPEDLRAQAAVESIPLEEEPSAAPAPRRSTTMVPKQAAPAAAAAPAAKKKDEEEYVSLGDWLREDDEPKSTRMVVQEEEPTGDEAADFADMLRKFKQGVSANVEEEDHEAHYDLGVAYKEMGLLDEAIAEFQKALRGTSERTRTFEALGHCFVEKGQLPVAASILSRALSEPLVRDESLVGVLYLLGAIAEEQRQFADAKKHYERVFAVDIQFRDIVERLNVVEQQLK